MFEEGAERHAEVQEKDQKDIESDWRDVLNVDDKFLKHRPELIKMLAKHQTMWDGHLGNVKATRHYIELTPDAKTAHQPPYRAGPKQRMHEREEVDKMLDLGVIEPSTSEWAAPVVFAPKKDGSLRFCVDYRRLNAVTVRDSYPIPRMDECIDSLGDERVFSTLDCNSGYWQVQIPEQDRDKTTFVTHHGLFQYTHMPFGLRNAPATFQRAMDIVLSSVKWNFCLVYLDDIVVFSPDAKRHIEHLDHVLTLLRQAGLTIKLKKCYFLHERIEYLGHAITPGELRVASKTVTAV